MKFSELEFVKLIGKGNFGEVWLGKYKQITVAIKKLYFVDDQFMQTYIRREMETLKGLHHPHIVQLIGICITEKDICIVTEYIEGGTLRQRLKGTSPNDMKLNTKLKIALQIADALEYLHGRDLMHRDLKGENVLLMDDDEVKICDFGLARPELTDEEKTMTNVGTDPWMAPEVLLDKNYNKSADVFSFGMILWELLTSKKPLRRKPRDGWRFVEKSAREKLNCKPPDMLWSLLCRCADAIPQCRPTFAQIKQELEEMLGKRRRRLSLTLPGGTLFSFGTPVHKEKEKDKEQEKEKEKEKDKERERAKRKKRSSKSAKRYSHSSSESDRRKKLLILHVKDDSSSPIDFFGLAKGLKQQEALLEKQELQLQSPQPHFGVMWQDLEVANQERDDPIEAAEESSGNSDCLTPKRATSGGGTSLRVTSGGVRRKHTRCRSLGGSLSRHKGKTVGILVSPHKQPPKSVTELQFTK